MEKANREKIGEAQSIIYELEHIEKTLELIKQDERQLDDDGKKCPLELWGYYQHGCCLENNNIVLTKEEEPAVIAIVTQILKNRKIDLERKLNKIIAKLK